MIVKQKLWCESALKDKFNDIKFNKNRNVSYELQQVTTK